ncbi:MAG: hypothetical protein LBS28_03000 [Streptococcaceae bacterium]|nr:hypothetical protein [Streptococcaceae bacterium]
MENKLKKFIAIFTVVISVTATVITSNLVFADPYDWQTKRVVAAPGGVASFVLGRVGGENGVDFITHFMHGYGFGVYPDVVRVHQYDGGAPLACNFYMKIPLNDEFRANASQYFGIDADELIGQELFIVINNPMHRDTSLLLRPQWTFASSVPGGRDISFDIGAHVEVDARVFGPTDNSVSDPIRYDKSQYVNFHDMKDKDGNWVIGVSPESLKLGIPNNDQTCAILSYVNFVDGQIAGQKRLTLNVVLSNEAWNSFIDQVNSHSAIGDIFLKMYRDNYISVEVMNHLLRFDDDMLSPFKPGVRSLAINPASKRSAQSTITSPDVDAIAPPNNDLIQVTKDSVLPPVTLLLNNPISTVSTPKRSVLTPTLSMSSGMPTTPIDNETLEVFRVYNPNDGMHHYTMNRGEIDVLVALGWRDEGVAFKCNPNGVAVYRLYNSNDGTHHYTMNENERDNLVALGWNYEGIAWYAKIEGTVPVFRMYNPGNGEHVWTTNYAEIENAVAHGWRYEGIAWYIE